MLLLLSVANRVDSPEKWPLNANVGLFVDWDGKTKYSKDADVDAAAAAAVASFRLIFVGFSDKSTAALRNPEFDWETQPSISLRNA